MTEPNPLDRIRGALAAGGSRQSPLYRWMMKHHDKLRGILGGVRPNWRVIAEELNAAGFRDGRGNPLNAGSARQVWWRVRHKKAEMSAARARLRAARRPAPDMPVVRDAATEKPSRARIQPARPRNVPEGGPATLTREVERPEPGATDATDAADEVERFREQLRRRTGKMPDPM